VAAFGEFRDGVTITPENRRYPVGVTIIPTAELALGAMLDTTLLVNRVLPAAPPPQPRAPGDYLERLHHGVLPLVRTVLYACPADCRAFVRRVVLTNNSPAVRTAELWLAGRRIEPAVALEANQAKKEDFAGWILLPGETIEGLASGSEVSLYASGVEEVTA